MAAKPAAKTAAPAKAPTATINRKRRNALERRSLPKQIKRMFLGATPEVYKLMLGAWKESRKKAPLKVD